VAGSAPADDASAAALEAWWSAGDPAFHRLGVAVGPLGFGVGAEPPGADVLDPPGGTDGGVGGHPVDVFLTITGGAGHHDIEWDVGGAVSPGIGGNGGAADPGDDTPTLPITGPVVAAAGGVGLAVVLGGVLLLLAARRRRVVLISPAGRRVRSRR
jgi:hypothetical protein